MEAQNDKILNAEVADLKRRVGIQEAAVHELLLQADRRTRCLPPAQIKGLFWMEFISGSLLGCFDVTPETLAAGKEILQRMHTKVGGTINGFYDVYALVDASLLPKNFRKLSKAQLIRALARAIYYIGMGSWDRKRRHVHSAAKLLNAGYVDTERVEFVWYEDLDDYVPEIVAGRPSVDRTMSLLRHGGLYTIELMGDLMKYNALGIEALLIDNKYLINLQNSMRGASDNKIWELSSEERMHIFKAIMHNGADELLRQPKETLLEDVFID